MCATRKRGFACPMELNSPSALADGRIKSSVAQPALVAFQISVARMLIRRTNLNIAATIGHSIGEIPAAHLAGVLSLPDAMRLATRRGMVVESKAKNGRMLVVSCKPETLTSLLGDHPSIEMTAFNGPELFTVGGAPDAVKELKAALRRKRIVSTEVDVSYALPYFPYGRLQTAHSRGVSGLALRAAANSAVFDDYRNYRNPDSTPCTGGATPDNRCASTKPSPPPRMKVTTCSWKSLRAPPSSNPSGTSCSPKAGPRLCSHPWSRQMNCSQLPRPMRCYGREPVPSISRSSYPRIGDRLTG